MTPEAEYRGPQIIYNCAGMLPITTSERLLRRRLREVKDIGFDGVSVQPYRGFKHLTQEELASLPAKFVLIENAFNPFSSDHLFINLVKGLVVNRLIRRKLLHDPNQPPVDWDALFPDKMTCYQLVEEMMAAFPKARFVSLNPEIIPYPGRTLLALHPNLGITNEKALELFDRDGIGFVFDFHHPESESISLPGKPSQPIKFRWEPQLQKLAQVGALKVVDYHPGSEVEAFMADHPAVSQDAGFSILKELVQAVKEHQIGILRIEVPVLGPKDVDRLKAIHDIARRSFP